MKNRVCITGIGLITPSGQDKASFWTNVAEGKNSITKIDSVPLENYPVQVAGQLHDFNVTHYVPKRFAVKTDTFTHYAWAASKMAIEDASLDFSELSPYDVGVWFGNNAGGWDICERGLFELYRDGPSFVNPWQATAWFLTSPQGYVSIGNNIRGMSKSFVCDRASSASALYFATRAIQAGHNQVALVGGTEAPINPFAITCYYETGQLAKSEEDCEVYRPFDSTRSGGVLAEGSVVLVLENYTFAKARGAHIYGEITGGAITTDYVPSHFQHLARAQQKALKEAEISPEDVGVIFAEGAGTVDSDLAEAHAIADTFKTQPEIPVSCPKAGFGHLYGASTAADIACGLLAVQHSTIPPTPNFRELDPAMRLYVPTTKLELPIHHFMVEARSREGNNICLVIHCEN